MASIQLKDVTKTFKATTAINNLSLEIQDGEFFCILGPPGAGKTTLLRLIVGLEKPDEGEILIEGNPVIGIHPSKRDISMIFQNLALYPDKTVFDNIAFPLRQQKLPEDRIRDKVESVARQLKIDWLMEKIPSKLSGGERQRVAIGRAIVRQPKAYLMDEPLSNLDAMLRLEMRVSLKELQTNLKETFVYVTHDQVEALSMGDRIGILNHGVIQQVDSPKTIYRFPKNMFVATILGSPPMNFLTCTINEEKGKHVIRHSAFSFSGSDSAFVQDIKDALKAGTIVLGIRPEDLTIQTTKPRGGCIPSEVYVTEPLGNETVIDVKVGEEVIKVLAEPDFDVEPGQKIWLTINDAKLHFFSEQNGECLFHSVKEKTVSLV